MSMHLVIVFVRQRKKMCDWGFWFEDDFSKSTQLILTNEVSLGAGAQGPRMPYSIQHVSQTTKAIYHNKHHIFWFSYGSEESTEPISINVVLLDVNITGAGLKGICLIYRKRRRRYNKISIMISSFLMISQIFPRLELQNFYIVRGTLLWTRPLRSFSTVSQKATDIYRNKKRHFTIDLWCWCIMHFIA